VTTIVEKEAQTVIKSAVFTQGAWQKILAFASLIALMAVFSIASDNFLQPDNLIGILQATAVNGVLAVATTFVIITGGIDLSIGTLMTLPTGVCPCP
jgi:ribose transport system permease protein